MLYKRLKYLPFVCLVFVIFFAVKSFGQNRVVFSSIKEVWQYADEHNINIAGSSSDVEASINEKKKSFSLLMPKISLSGSYTDNIEISPTQIPAEIFGGQKGTYTQVKLGQKYNYAGSLNFNADIINTTSWLNIAGAELKKNFAKQSAVIIKQQTYEQLTLAYYLILLSKYTVEISAGNKNLADTLLFHTERKYDQGLVDKYSVNVASINALKTNDNLLHNQQTYYENINTLKSLLNLSVSDSLLLPEKFATVIYKQNSDSILFPDPKIRASELKTLIAKNSLRQIKSTWLPMLSIVGSFGYNQNSNTFELIGAGQEWNPQQYWGLRLSFPIFTGGEKWLNMQTSFLQYEQAQRIENYTITAAHLEDENIKTAYNISYKQMQAAKEAMKLAKENFDYMNNKYLEGIVGFEKQSDAFTDYLNSQTYYLNSLTDFCVALTKIYIRSQEIH